MRRWLGFGSMSVLLIVLALLRFQAANAGDAGDGPDVPGDPCKTESPTDPTKRRAWFTFDPGSANYFDEDADANPPQNLPAAQTVSGDLHLCPVQAGVTYQGIIRFQREGQPQLWNTQVSRSFVQADADTGSVMKFYQVGICPPPGQSNRYLMTAILKQSGVVIGRSYPYLFVVQQPC